MSPKDVAPWKRIALAKMYVRDFWIRESTWLAASDNKGRPGKNAGIHRSIDGGKTWKHVLKDVRAVRILDTNERVFAAAQEGIYVSMDAGATWTLLGLSMVHALARVGNRVAAGGRMGAYLSKDKGHNWKTLAGDGGLKNSPRDERGGDSADFLAIMFRGDELWASTYDGFIYATDGKKWRCVKKGEGRDTGDQDAIYSLAEHGKLLLAGARWGVQLSKDGGKTWKRAPKGKDPMDLWTYYDIRPWKSGLIAANGSKAVRSKDGVKWTPFSPDDVAPLRFTIDGEKLYAATAAGIWGFADRD